MKQLVFAKQAVTDLEAITDYIAADSPIRATTFVQELRDACVELRTMPERYPPGSTPSIFRHSAQGLRQLSDFLPRRFGGCRNLAYSSWGDGLRANFVSQILNG